MIFDKSKSLIVNTRNIELIMHKTQGKKRSILFLTPLPPPVHGSAMVSNQIRESALINEAFTCDFVNLSTSRTIDEIGKGGAKKILRFAAAWFQTLGKLLSRRYDACYIAITCHGTGFLKDAPFALLAKLCCGTLIIHQHNKGMAEDVDRVPYRWLLRWVYRKASVVLLSWRLYPDIERVVSKSQVYVCPNGIADVVVGGHRGNNLLFLSNLIPSKGVMTLLDACKILKDRGVRFHCDFVGGESRDISEADFCEAVACRGLAGNVVYLGKRFGEEKEKCFSESAVFVQPTCNDCFPLTILEAMQHALPVVATDEGGILDMVEDGVSGLICKKNDPEDLADKLQQLMLNPTLARQFGEAGRNRYLSYFTNQHFENNLLSVLRQIVDAPIPK